MVVGSSPLSRGILRSRRQGCRHQGIIPALAGNTLYQGSSGPYPADHPRSRGEYLLVAEPCTTLVGSSPLSRGILLGAVTKDPPEGIIPALAGNTAGARSSCQGARDHPRSRGEYRAGGEVLSLVFGSSPLSRGIRGAPRRRRLRRGIIPALAGNTPGSHQAVLPHPDHPRSRGEYWG